MSKRVTFNVADEEEGGLINDVAEPKEEASYITLSATPASFLAAQRDANMDNMPYISSDPNIFSRWDRMKLAVWLSEVFNGFAIGVCILMYAHGSMDDTAVQYSAANFFAWLGCFDFLISMIILCRNKILNHWIMDRSFQQNTKYHIVFAALAMTNWFLHGLLMFILNETNMVPDITTKDTSGLMAWVVLIFMIPFSLPRFRKWFYYGFYILHWFFTLWIFVFGSIHSVTVVLPLMTVSLAIYVADFTYQRWFAFQQRSVKISNMKIVPGKVARIDFDKKSFPSYKAGQFIYLTFPEDIGALNSHPFSIATAPHQDIVSVYVRDVGAFTGKIRKIAYAVQKEIQAAQNTDKTAGRASASKKRAPVVDFPAVRVEGPYGLLTTQAHDLYHYKHIVFIAGGIGITPVQALFNDYIHHKLVNKSAKSIAYVEFIWAVKEKEELCNQAVKLNADLDQVRFFHFQPCLLDKTEIETVKQANPDAIIKIDLRLSRTEIVRLVSFQDSLSKTPSPKLPKKPDCVTISNHGVDLFRVIRESVERLADFHDDHLAVIACGPPSMIKDLRKACSDHAVNNIDLYVESFLP